jgi:hypothetical protein
VLDPDDENRGRPPSFGIPFALAENPPRLRHRLIKALRGNLDIMFDALSVPAAYLARSDRHNGEP